MQVTLNTYSLARLFDEGRLNQLSAIAWAKEQGFDAIELVDVIPHDGAAPAEYARRLRDEAERVGIPIVQYTVGADFLSGSDGDLAREVARVCRQVDIAVLLGARGMRHDATTGYPRRAGQFHSFAYALPRLTEGCRQVTAYAAEHGVRTMVENHGIFAQDSTRVEQLANAVDHPNFGLLMDMGNFLCADEDPAVACGRVAPYALHVHAKDFFVRSGQGVDPGTGYFRSRAGNYLRGTIVGHGNVPVAQCLRILRETGYDGTISIEFEGMEDTTQALAIGSANLRRLWGDTPH